MTYRVRITPSALASAEEIYLWLKEQDPLEAVQWFNGLFEASESLTQMPKRCGIAPERELLGVEVRCLYYRKFYRILFCVEATTVIIHHIRHTSRDTLNVEEFYGLSDT
jgi:plasmid stabilization system protein ParE